MVDALPKSTLRWRCDPASLPFATTADVEPVSGIIGQPGALDALRFGLEFDAPGQNVFIRGLEGTGRLTMVRRLLEELQPACPTKKDRCYIHDFSAPDRPRLVSLPPGKGRELRRRVHALADFVRHGLPDALSAPTIKARREAIETHARAEVEHATQPFEKSLQEAGMALVSLQMGPVAQTAIFPVVEGKPVPPEEFEGLREQGKISVAQHARFAEQHEGFAKRLAEITDAVRRIRKNAATLLEAMLEQAARAVLEELARQIEADFPAPEISRFLRQIVDDVAENHLEPDEDRSFAELYGVNVVLEHGLDEGCPIIIENAPTLPNLVGSVGRDWGPRGPGRGDYRMIRAGALLRADGGYLIMQARDVLAEPGAWKVLLRTLRTGLLDIVPPEVGVSFWGQTIQPEAVPVRVKVILIGGAEIYYLLDTYDREFSHLFKVLADFDAEIPRDRGGILGYAGVLARIAKEEQLRPFDRTAVAALAEHGARIASHKGKLTSRFGRVVDIAREAEYLARKRNDITVTGDDVRLAVRRTKQRADLPSRRFRALLADGTIRLQTKGAVAGQINGLAVVHAGPITYGFPARITATIGAGSAGVINIEREAAMSGSIHTKGFYILGGLLRHLLQTEHPLAFSASIAFEQSYGGIDGDSASGAEICCLLSALAGVKIRQDFAMTGAIDQVGHILAVGAVNEKIEGFFDTCKDLGLTGTQGVIIPLANAGDLMLRHDVMEACGEKKFHVYAVQDVREALELLVGMPVGERGEDGAYPEDSLLGICVRKAFEYWVKAARMPIEVAAEEPPVEEPEAS
ncbi:MAG: Lon protease family protein [Planctomycetota bacterium]